MEPGSLGVGLRLFQVLLWPRLIEFLLEPGVELSVEAFGGGEFRAGHHIVVIF
ncbi:MAG: hypothetical protein QXI12_01340 [Candidatus Methanomethyliaceae archaeon]